MDETREINIDLRKILYMMKNKLAYILLATVLLGAVAGCFTHFFIDPVYSSTVKMYVYSNPDRVSTNSSITGSEIDASKDLMGTYVDILTSDAVMDKVIEDLNLNVSSDALRTMVHPVIPDNTQVFRVTVRSTDPYLAAKIANSIAKVAPDEIVRIVKAGGVEIVDKARVPKKPSSPNLNKNTLIGAIAGFVISFLGVFIYELFDTTITKAEDLEREFGGIPILGTVPKLEAVETKPTNDINVDNALGIKPSNAILENLQSMKGDVKND